MLVCTQRFPQLIPDVRGVSPRSCAVGDMPLGVRCEVRRFCDKSGDAGGEVSGVVKPAGVISSGGSPLAPPRSEP